MELKKALEEMRLLEKRRYAYNHAIGLLSVDAMTVAPSKSYIGRGETMGILSGEAYDLFVNEDVGELLGYISEHSEEITDRSLRREAEVLKEEYDKIKAFPRDEYVEYSKLLNDADAIWHSAKADNDFASFEPYLTRIMEFQRKMAEWYEPGTSSRYDTLLNEYEKGMTGSKLDEFFKKLSDFITPLVKEIDSVQDRVDVSFMQTTFPTEKQRILSERVMALMGLTPDVCVLGETEHPFTEGFNKYDVRITTKYREKDFLDSMYSVIHEGGHAIYELSYDDEHLYTVLAGGASTALHESQSRFFENIVGRSEAFISYMAPTFRELFPEALGNVSDRALYKAANRSTPSLIRTEADELTYPLHVMIRYILERALIDGGLKVKDLPGEWNGMYKKYLGIDVPDDTRGVLQDSHWSGGLVGYFPSYALGSAYGAQMLQAMKKDVDFEGTVGRGDLAPVKTWLREKIHRYGGLLKPEELIQNSCGAPFDASYYVSYLEKKYRDIYEL